MEETFFHHFFLNMLLWTLASMYPQSWMQYFVFYRQQLHEATNFYNYGDSFLFGDLLSANKIVLVERTT